MTTRICLVRHGETTWNAERRMQGHLDVPLNETGFAQARATAQRLAAARFDAAYSSDLLRTRQTAETISVGTGYSITYDSGLRERHYGAFQTLTYGDAKVRFPEDYARFESRDLDFPIPGGGESLAGFAARITATLERLADAHRGQTILIITHGGVLDIAHRLATGKPLTTPRDFTIPNAALNWISRTGNTWELLAWAEQHHLASALDELSNA